MYETIAMFANDATACFDGMVPGVSSLIARKFGVSAPIMECRNETLKDLEHNICTRCGDSEETYKEGEDDDSLCGEVQGKGDVASLWCLMSHTILNAHTSLHSPVKMHGVKNEMILMKNNDAFVDNTDGYADSIKRGTDSEKEAVETLQKKAQSW